MGKAFKKLLPYIVLALISLATCYAVFFPGLWKGDDFNFHSGNIYEIIKTIKEGHPYSPISGYIGAGVGSGTRLFYSPITYLYYAGGILLLDFVGIGFINAFKILFILTVYVSGIFVYLLIKKISKGNEIASIFAGILYIVYPYRLFDGLCRFALAESFCFTFIPLFFLGLYSVVYEDKNNVKVKPFIITICGSVLMLLSHNISGFYGALFGVLFLLFSIKKLFNKNRRFWLYCGISVILIIGLISFYMVDVLKVTRDDYYNITDEVRMWVSADQVSSRGSLKEILAYTGFLNVQWLSARNEKYTLWPLVFSLISFCVGIALFLVVERVFKKKPIWRHLSIILSSLLLIGLSSIFAIRISLYVSDLIFICSYLLYKYRNNILEHNDEKTYLLNDTLLYFLIVAILICLALLFIPKIWLYMPTIFRNIQFPWRMWMFVQFLLTVLFGLIASKMKYKRIGNYLLIALVALVFAGNQPTLEREVKLKMNDVSVSSIGDETLYPSSVMGWNKEYLPQIFYKNYKSEYSNSLYLDIRNVLNSSSSEAYQDLRINPVILDGEGVITVKNSFADEWVIEVGLTSDCIVQMPLVYYSGYVARSENGQKVKGEAIDGLVSFKLDKGVYTVNISYEGSAANKVFNIVSICSVFCVIGFGVYGAIYSSIRRKDINNI